VTGVPSTDDTPAPSIARAPSVTVVLELERAPVVLMDALNEGEAERLTDWIRTHDEYVDLVQQAIDLSRWQRAA
jgi:hypothetical protein